MHAERLEQRRLPDLAAHAAPDLGGVVEHHQRGHAAYVLEGVLHALAHAHGPLVAEQLGQAVVGLGERLGEVVHARELAAVLEVGLAEVDLHGAGRPLQVHEGALRSRQPGLGPELPHVALHGRVAALEAVLVDEAPVHAPGRVALLVVGALVLLEHPGDLGLVGVEDAALGPLDRALRGEVVLCEVLPDRRVGEPGGLLDLRRGQAPRGHVPDLHLLRHAQQSPSCLPRTVQRICLEAGTSGGRATGTR